MAATELASAHCRSSTSDDHRVLARQSLEHLLDLLNQPVPQLGQRSQIAERRRIQKRLCPSDQRVEQSAHRDHAVAAGCASRANKHPKSPRNLDRLGEQPRLTGTRRALDHRHRAPSPDLGPVAASG